VVVHAPAVSAQTPPHLTSRILFRKTATRPSLVLFALCFDQLQALISDFHEILRQESGGLIPHGYIMKWPRLSLTSILLTSTCVVSVLALRTRPVRLMVQLASEIGEQDFMPGTTGEFAVEEQEQELVEDEEDGERTSDNAGPSQFMNIIFTVSLLCTARVRGRALTSLETAHTFGLCITHAKAKLSLRREVQVRCYILLTSRAIPLFTSFCTSTPSNT
jgi:hypothetical protein